MLNQATVTLLDNQQELQQEPNIPIARLPQGAWLLVRGMRLWKQAFAQRTCVLAMIHQDFSRFNCEAALRYLDEMMCLLHVGARRPMTVNAATALTVTGDELRVASVLRLIAENKHEQASLQLHDLVRGPLNFSVIRACTDLVALFSSQQLAFQQKPQMALTHR